MPPVDVKSLRHGRHLLVMQGAPGSGKSTVARGILASVGHGAILSTDDFWERQGEYRFDERLRHVAHAWNERRAQKRFEETNAAGLPDDLVVIDNTNATPSSAKRYTLPALANGYRVHVLRIDPGLEECLRRNAQRPEHRRVPDESVARIYARLQDLSPLAL